MSTTNKHKKFMAEAIKEARKGMKAKHGGPFGAVIVKNNKVVSRGHNEVLKNQDPTCHGEMMAIRAACKKLKTFDLSGCVIYTTGFPCPMCMGACKWAHIKQVYYGCDVNDTAKIGFDDRKFYKWKLKATCVQEKPCKELYEEFKKIEDVHY